MRDFFIICRKFAAGWKEIFCISIILNTGYEMRISDISTLKNKSKYMLSINVLGLRKTNRHKITQKDC